MASETITNIIIRKFKKIRYRLKRNQEDYDCREVFSQIYRESLWGGKQNEIYSGRGSHDEIIIEPYIDYVNKLIESYGIKSICEIGSGDFHIMNRVLNSNPHINYSGIDVVPEVIDRNLREYGNSRISFIMMDASDEHVELPHADMLIVRQVLQHLSNEKIKKILERIGNYDFALITEHLYIGRDVKYNTDKSTGLDIRVNQRSGVYIDKPPFCITNAKVVIEVPYKKNEVLRTWLVKTM